MRYNDRPKGYLSSVVNDLRDARYGLGILYASSEQRARREETSLPVALIRNLRDFYHGGLDSLLIPVRAYGSSAISEPQYRANPPTEFFMGSKSTKHKHPTSNKQKRKLLQKKRRKKRKR